MSEPQPKTAKPPRVRSVDWHRGLVVLVMIECHTLVFLAASHDHEPARAVLNNMNGLVAPSFLFLAGFAFAYVASNVAGDQAARLRRSRTSLRRIGTVILAATLMRAVSSPAITAPELRYWLQVDILSCIAYSLLLIWLLFRFAGAWPRVCAGVCLAVALAFFAAAPWTEGVRDAGPITFFLNGSTGSMFPLAPWAGLVFLGGVTGIIAALGGMKAYRAALASIVALFGTVALAGQTVMDWYSSPHGWLVVNASERIWKLATVGIVLSLIETVTSRRPGFAESVPVRFVTFFGTSSLSAYCTHLLMIYGAWGLRPLNAWHGQLDWGGYAAFAVGIITVTYLFCRVLDASEQKRKAARAPAR